MIGVITSRDVLRNLHVIVREFGVLCTLRCFGACLFGPKTTFLEIAFRPGNARTTASPSRGARKMVH